MTWDDDLPIFRPKFGRARTSGQGNAEPSFRNAVLAAMRRRGQGASRSARPARRSSVAVPRPGAFSRRVTVKAHYVKMTASGVKAARLHLAYLERDGVEKDGTKGILYGADGFADRAELEQARPGEKHQFRIILSPEDAGELDLTDFVRRYMKEVESDLGRRLDWAAVNHYNTAHPHAHIVIRGVDLDGAEVRLDRGYISHGMRERAQELATRELGPRHEKDIRLQGTREVDQNRFTGLDREIARLAKDGVVEPRTSQARSVDPELVLGRLQHLESLGLAERRTVNTWKLGDQWQAELRELGAYGDIIKKMHREVRGDPARYHILRPDSLRPNYPGMEQPVVGRVAHMELSDDGPNRYHIIVEAPDGRGYHACIHAAAADKLRQGDLAQLRIAPGRSSGQDNAPPKAELRVLVQPLRVEEQVQYLGPTWLDRLRRSELAPYGFGAEIGQALDKRDAVLRGRGIDPEDPRRMAALRELERRAVAERHKSEAHERLLEKVPRAFRGRVSVSERTPAGASYAIVSDGSRFVVLPLTQELKAHQGQEVVLSRDEKKRLRAKALAPAPERQR